jgi:hypothetical protein
VSTSAEPSGEALRREEHAPSDVGAIVPLVEQLPGGICLACGSDLSEPLRRSASLRCHDCRDSGAPLCRELVEPHAPDVAPTRRRWLFRRVASATAR